MTEVQAVSADEAREFAGRADDALARGDWMDDWENHAEIISDLAHTVAAEPDRTRAAWLDGYAEGQADARADVWTDDPVVNPKYTARGYCHCVNGSVPGTFDSSACPLHMPLAPESGAPL